VLAWAVKFGRRFATSEAYDIATYITDTAYRLVRRSSYYSPAVAQLFEAMAHVHYMQKHWVESITTLNVAHDVSFRHEDWDSACLALLRSSETYEAAKELALAKRCVQRASEFEGRIGETVSSHLLNRSGILFRQLSPSNDSGFSLLMPPLTEQLPGTVEFVSTLAAVEELTDAILTKLNTDSSLDWQSVGLSAGPILRMYGVALDRAGEQTKSAGMLWTAYRIQRLMRDYPEAAVTLHEYGVALSRANRLVAARRAYYVAMTLKRRHGSLNAQSADVSLKSFVKASVILGIGTNLAEHLKALREAMSRQTPAPSVLFDIHGSYDDLITIANGYILTGQAGIAGEVASEAAKQFDDSSDRGKHLGAVELGGLLIRVGRTDEALQYLRQAIAAFETDRQQISESHRTEWQRYVVPAVALFLDASYSHSQSLAGECLSKIELVKVRTLLERFGRIRVTPGAELSSEMAAQDEHNREATAKALAAHLVTKSSVIRGEFMEYQLRAQDEHVFLQSLESTAPEYVRLRRGLPFEPTDIVSERINDKSTRIFVLHQTPESIYVWHLDGHGQIATWRKIDVPAADLDRVAGAISDAASRHAWVGDALDWLSDLLFADVDVPAETDVCIVPSGRLIDLPFAAFRIRGQYLVEKWPLVILPSFSLAGFWSRSPTVDATKSLVLSDSLGDLTGAKEEAVAIANMMKSGLLVNKEMTRERILACLPDVDLLHVACHAIFDSRSPLDSGIPLADGRRFTCRDLMTLSTRGKVAFLSACESNKVATASGDELTGLFPSLLYSGFEAVVGSLWKVPDRETRKLALTFYRAVLDGRPLHCALRDAQLSLLYGTKNLSPYYWAAWQLVGNWQVRVSKEETLAQ